MTDHRSGTGLVDLRAAGASVWLDTLSRALVDSGALTRLRDECGVTGATSNPTIFAQALEGSDDYDADIAEAVRCGVTDPDELFLRLALEDVRRAAAVFRPAYDASAGTDGFVSFECTPDLADDTDGTVAQALALWDRLGVPNVMIKVPATAAGVPAIEELTARGVNVNVTLLFSVGRYAEAVEAYLRGLERRAARGDALGGVASVASFFVSRVDAKADPILGPGSPLRGRVAIANARRAYGLWRSEFSGPRWQALADQGARPQRPLWASTQPKDPAYSDVLYVEELVAAGIVNTMPLKTLEAFAAHGTVPRLITDALADADEVLAGAARHGLDLAAVTADLEREGIASFCASYAQLRRFLTSKAEVVRELGPGGSKTPSRFRANGTMAIPPVRGGSR